MRKNVFSLIAILCVATPSVNAASNNIKTIACPLVLQEDLKHLRRKYSTQLLTQSQKSNVSDSDVLIIKDSLSRINSYIEECMTQYHRYQGWELLKI